MKITFIPLVLQSFLKLRNLYVGLIYKNILIQSDPSTNLLSQVTKGEEVAILPQRHGRNNSSNCSTAYYRSTQIKMALFFVIFAKTQEYLVASADYLDIITL